MTPAATMTFLGVCLSQGWLGAVLSLSFKTPLFAECPRVRLQGAQMAPCVRFLISLRDLGLRLGGRRPRPKHGEQQLVVCRVQCGICRRGRARACSLQRPASLPLRRRLQALLAVAALPLEPDVLLPHGDALLGDRLGTRARHGARHGLRARARWTDMET